MPLIDLSPSDSMEEAALKIPTDADVMLFLCGTCDPLVDPQIRSVLARVVVPAALSVNALIVDDGSRDTMSRLIGEVAQTFDTPPKLLAIASSAEDNPAANHDWIVRLPAELMGDPEIARYRFLSELSKSTGKRKKGIAIGALVAGGGDSEKSMALRFVRRGWPVLVLQGGGGWGDVLLTASVAAAENSRALDKLDPELREIVENGRIAPLPLTGSTEDLTRCFLSFLEAPRDVLEQAWRLCSRLDTASLSHQVSFRRIQNAILSLMLLPTFLAIADLTIRNLDPKLDSWMNAGLGWVHLLAIIVPIVITTLVAYNSRIRDGNQWVLLRAAAESIKNELYRYRTRTGDYTTDRKGRTYADSRLAAAVKDISVALSKTEANRASLPSLVDQITPEQLKPLSPQGYLENRVEDQILYYETYTKRLHHRFNNLQLWILVMGGFGTFLSAIHREGWMALTTAFATALTNKLEVDQVQNSLRTYNTALTNLRNIEAWWTGLSLWERTRRANYELLVDQTEKALGLHGSGWVTEMQTTLSQLTERESGMIHKSE